MLLVAKGLNNIVNFRLFLQINVACLMLPNVCNIFLCSYVKLQMIFGDIIFYKLLILTLMFACWSYVGDFLNILQSFASLNLSLRLGILPQHLASTLWISAQSDIEYPSLVSWRNKIEDLSETFVIHIHGETVSI